MDDILTSPENIKGLIYIIRNNKNTKCYVGQTLSHRMNRGKYRPFGIQGRFKDHLSEAICNTKKKQCWYLNNAIRSYGCPAFTVELLHTCPPTELDTWEQHYITEKNSMYPNGYNLTRGGKTFANAKCSEQPLNPPAGTRGGCESRSEDTKKLISKRLQEHYADKDNAKNRMALTQQQHQAQKLERFKGSVIDQQNIEKYIFTQKNKVRVVIDGKRIEFVGKYQTNEELRQRAVLFLKEIATTATPSNCSGNP